MSRLTRKLPTLTALVTFECAARLRSFKEAAEELGVTPGAVSHQIKALEAELGQKLFLRQHRGVELTQQGATLFGTVEKAFADVAETVQNIQDVAAEASVTVGATTAVSSLWLGPAIVRFWRENNAVSVNQLVSDSRFSAFDVPELSIRYGRDPRPGLEQHVLYRDTLVPVCAPALASQLGSLSLGELARQPLIHLIAEDVNWTSWQSWFQSQGCQERLRGGMRVNNYMIALAAAEEEAGIVLGWKRLLRPKLAQGSLVCLTDHALDAPNQFHLVSLPENQLTRDALHLRSWLLDNL